MSKLIKIFTDGSCLGNPGPGGYGIILQYQSYEKKMSTGFIYTTNNRMELMGVIVGLESLKKPCIVDITTDSKYVQKGITSWILLWKKQNWKTSKKKPVKNVDLWIRLYTIIQYHTINWFWIKAHTGHIENEKCDQMARQSAKNPKIIDIYYEKMKYF
ncbi:ribonuclease HI [Buchnera aphidicola]|uniref:ribonuclease HI n=1 Tax=Buchnera aphidicola TaxID=9 RepID=UPI003BEF0ADF